jgi:hypothetical protein
LDVDKRLDVDLSLPYCKFGNYCVHLLLRSSKIFTDYDFYSLITFVSDATGRWFSPGTPVSSTDKTDRHDITEISLKVVLNTIIHPAQSTITQTDMSHCQIMFSNKLWTITETKHASIRDHSRFRLSCLGHLVFLLPSGLNHLAFERT